MDARPANRSSADVAAADERCGAFPDLDNSTLTCSNCLQNLGTGETLLADVPAPLVSPGHLLIATSKTLVSAGTERMLVDFGRANLLDKARQQPDKVKMVLDKVRTDGLFATLDAVRSKLDQPLALGILQCRHSASRWAAASKA